MTGHRAKLAPFPPASYLVLEQLQHFRRVATPKPWWVQQEQQPKHPQKSLFHAVLRALSVSFSQVASTIRASRLASASNAWRPAVVMR